MFFLFWISLNTNEFELPSPLSFSLHWIAYTSAQPIFYCVFWFCLFDFDVLGILNMIPLLKLDCTHLPLCRFVVANFVHGVLSWREILTFYLIKSISIVLCQCFEAYSQEFLLYPYVMKFSSTSLTVNFIAFISTFWYEIYFCTHC